MGRARLALWPILFPDKFDRGAFETLFLEELDSAFTADLACCDACYDRHLNRWPGLRTDIEMASYSLDGFYASSAFSEFYTKEEFERLCRQMGCPVCDGPLEHNLYPFNPNFDVPDGFDADLDVLIELCRRTPFLVLTDPLARRVLKEVKRASRLAKPGPVLDTLFRARVKPRTRTSKEFLAPSPELCGEGRYNHAGHPALYLASSAGTAYAEVGSPQAGCVVASITLTSDHKILDLSSSRIASDLLAAVAVSSLLSAPAKSKSGGWDKPEYTFSRFFSDCAAHVGFTGLKYPSVANAKDYNLVLFAAPRVDQVRVGRPKNHPQRR